MNEKFTASDPLATPAQDLIEIFNKDNPRALINLIPGYMAEELLNHRERAPELFIMNETELRKNMRTNEQMPNVTDNRLRMKFWVEYDRCQHNLESKMNMPNVYSGITSLVWDRFLKNTRKVAWLVCPPMQYIHQMQEALNYGVDELRDILQQSHVDDKGKVDVNLARLKLSIFKMIDDRLHGNPTQNINQKSISLSLTEHREVMAVQGAKSEESLMVRLKELERQERAALHLPEKQEIKQVTPTQQAMVININGGGNANATGNKNRE